MDDNFHWSTYLDSQTVLLDLPLDEARKAEVTLHLARIAAMVEPLLKFDEDQDFEPAPVFRP